MSVDTVFEGVPLSAEIPSVTIPQFIRQSACERADDTALIDGAGERSYSYGNLDSLSGRFAAGLAQLGFRPGDILVLFMPNLPEWAIAALGTFTAGGVVSPANSTCSASDLAHQLQDTSARFVVTVSHCLPVISEAITEIDGITVISLGEAPQTVSFASVLACSSPVPNVCGDPDELAALPFSSGTSGLPKGVMLTHRNIVSNVRQFCQAFLAPDHMVSLVVLPLSHAYGFTVVLLAGLAAGGKLVIVPRFEPHSFLKAVRDHRVTHLMLVPPLMQFLATHPLVDDYDLSSLQTVVCGAAPLASTLEQIVSTRLKCEVKQGFGMTEASGVISVQYSGRNRLGSCGELLPGTQARIVDPLTRIDQDRGTPGEIWFRGPQAFTGYLNNSSETAVTLMPDGWVRSGDIGHFDSDGYLFISDRVKELIKVKGYQVAPAEIEALLYTHPSVADAAVIGRFDERVGEIPVAYVVRRGLLDAFALKSWVGQRVSKYKQLGDVVFCEAIPRTPSGKILRRILRNQDARRG